MGPLSLLLLFLFLLFLLFLFLLLLLVVVGWLGGGRGGGWVGRGRVGVGVRVGVGMSGKGAEWGSRWYSLYHPWGAREVGNFERSDPLWGDRMATLRLVDKSSIGGGALAALVMGRRLAKSGGNPLYGVVAGIFGGMGGFVVTKTVLDFWYKTYSFERYEAQRRFHHWLDTSRAQEHAGTQHQQQQQPPPQHHQQQQ